MAEMTGADDAQNTILEFEKLRTAQGYSSLSYGRHSISNNFPSHLYFNSFINVRAAFAILGDVFVNGQGQDVWCRSKIIIKDTTMYKPGSIFDDLVEESCFYFHLFYKYYYPFGPDVCEINSQIGDTNTLHFCICSD
jgi:hypothetical protein